MRLAGKGIKKGIDGRSRALGKQKQAGKRLFKNKSALTGKNRRKNLFGNMNVFRFINSAGKEKSAENDR